MINHLKKTMMMNRLFGMIKKSSLRDNNKISSQRDDNKKLFQRDDDDESSL